jgi:hypothetical protein
MTATNVSITIDSILLSAVNAIRGPVSQSRFFQIQVAKAVLDAGIKLPDDMLRELGLLNEQAMIS